MQHMRAWYNGTTHTKYKTSSAPPASTFIDLSIIFCQWAWNTKCIRFFSDTNFLTTTRVNLYLIPEIEAADKQWACMSAVYKSTILRPNFDSTSLIWEVAVFWISSCSYFLFDQKHGLWAWVFRVYRRCRQVRINTKCYF